MTPEEYANKVEEVIEEKDLEIWKVFDLRLMAKLSKQRGYVYKIEEILLDLLPKPIRGQLMRPPPPVPPKAVQVKLF